MFLDVLLCFLQQTLRDRLFVLVVEVAPVDTLQDLLDFGVDD